jgi:hypothetical protein
MNDAKARLLQMIADEPHMGGGGLLKAIGKAQKAGKAAETADEIAMRLYHGSPHVMPPTPENKLGKFDPAKIGTGEGAQSYGYGHYLAQSRDVAKNYRPRSPQHEAKLVKEYDKAQAAQNYPKMEVLEDAMLHQAPDEILRKYSNAEYGYTPEHAKAAADYAKWYEANRPEMGGLYHVDVPKSYLANMLDYDKPINKQSEQVKALLEKAGINTDTSATAGSMIGGQEAHLSKHGIPGVKYYDEKSRHLANWEVGKSGKGTWMLKNNELSPNQWKEFPTEEEALAAYNAMPDTGTRNFVVFPGNEDMLNVVQRDKRGGAVHMAGGGRTPKMPWERYAQSKKEAEMRARPINPVAGAIKSGADYATQLIDKGPSFPNLVGGLVGAVPFVGPDLRKRMEASNISIPTDITLGSNVPAEDYEYGQRMQYKKPGISTTSVPTKNVLEALKVSDLVGTPGLSKVAEDIGYGQMPDALDLLDAASVAGLGYGAAKAGIKGGRKAAGALSNLAKSEAGYKLAQKVINSPYMAPMSMSTMNIVKPEGGNWFGGRVEKELGRLKSLGVNGTDPVATLAELEKKYGKQGMEEVLASGLHPMLKENAALNKWIDSNLGNYVKKQMATPNDPVRKLAEQGITHKASLPNEYHDSLAPTEQRVSAGFPAEGVGQSPLARSWENASDEAVAAYNAGEIQNAPQKAERINAAKQKVTQELEALNQKFENHIRNFGLKENEVQGLMKTMTPLEKGEMIGDDSFSKANMDYLFQRNAITESEAKMMEDNPWIAKVDPNSSVYSPHIGDLGFDHIVDVLNEDLANGRIRPEQLNKISMEQAVRRTHEFDQEMAKRMAAAQTKVTEGMPVHKEYPEGYKWIELSQPKELPEGWSQEPSGAYVGPKGERTTVNPNYETLRQSLKYEGDTMGHCVGGYCPDVAGGRSRIFSLRDAKGEPHVTVETQSVQKHPIGYTMNGGEDFPKDFRYENGSITPEQQQQIYQRAKQLFKPESTKDISNHRMDVFQQAADEVLGPQPERIVQIKGKQNRAPKEEYLPYVQDFVKGGKFSDVGDLQNAGLYSAKDVHNFMPENFRMSKNARTLAIGRAKAAGDMPDYMTKPEYEAMLLKHAPEDIWAAEKKKYADESDELLRQLQPPEEGMAEGGEAKSFFEEKSAKQRLLDMIAKEPHMDNGVMAVQLPLQLQGEIANDAFGGIGGGGRATYTRPIGKDAAIRAYIEGGGYKPKDMDYKGQVNNMGISYEKEFKDGGNVKPLSERFNLGKAGKFDPVGNAKKTLGRALDVASQIPGNLQALVSDPAAYIKALPKPTEEQMLGAFMPGDMGMMGSIKPQYLPGVHYADPLAPPTMKMSEALGNAGAEGKTLNFTETDRSRVFGPNRGGAGFAGLQHYSLPHKEANTVWGFGSKGITEKKVNQNDPENTIWTTYAGSPTQHKSNTVVVKDALKQLQEANLSGDVHPAQIEFINDRIRSAVNNKKKPLFPSDFDITDPKVFDFATTFDRRAAISDALMGVGVKKPMISREFKAANPGIKWQDAANIEAILKRETDPAMVGVNTNDVGPNLFVMDNGIIHRPDLNEAFPYQVTGTDLGMRYELTPFRDAAPDWIQARGIKPDEPINAWAMSRAAPSQFVSDKYLTGLQKKGRKAGGLAQIKKVKRHGNTVSN